MLASIDIGSNTVRLLVASLTGSGELTPVHYERRITRLAGGLSEHGFLQDKAMSRTLAALADFKTLCENYPVVTCQAVGTAAFRQADNGCTFAEQITQQTGIPVQVLSGWEEARLTASGVRLALTGSVENLLIFDIGGGSTEFIHVLNGQIGWLDSCPLGVVRLCDQCLNQVAMQAQIDHHLDQLPAEIFKQTQPLTLVGTAGTVTSLAALALEMSTYDWRRVNNFQLSKLMLECFLAQLAPLAPKEREALPGLEAGRGDLIIPGLLIVLSLLGRCQAEQITVSDFGILEGVARELAGNTIMSRK